MRQKKAGKGKQGKIKQEEGKKGKKTRQGIKKRR